MSFVKIKSNNLGVCPYCNSEEIDKGTARFEFDMMYFPCKCEKCGKVQRKHLNPGDKPEAFFKTDAEKVIVREYCNLHGLWKSEK